MAPAIDFEVMDGGTEYGIESRPVRRLPDGDYGVVYGGRVQRLRNRIMSESDARRVDPTIEEWSDWEIDLSAAESFSKSECPPLRTFRGSPFVKDSQPIAAPEPPSIDWYLEDSLRRRYLAVDCDDDGIEDVIETLHKSDVEVINHGRSRRSAANDRMYDWFVRLPVESVSGLSEVQLRTILQSIFRPNDPLSPIIKGLDALGISLTTDGATVFYRGEIALLTPELSEAVKSRKSELVEFLVNNGFVESTGELGSSEVAPELDPANVVTVIMDELDAAGISGDYFGKLTSRLREKLDSVAARDGSDPYLQARDIFLQGVNSLSRALDNVTTRWVSSLEEKQSFERRLAEARETIESLQAVDRDDVESLNSTDTTVLDELVLEKQILEEKLESTQQELKEAMDIWKSEQSAVEDLEDQNQRLINRYNSLKRQFDSVGETAELVEIILFNATPRISYRLDSIDVLSGFSDPSAAMRMVRGLDDKSLPGGSSVGGAPGWREHHVSTGDSDDGRIYYKTQDGRVQVKIGKKHTQKQDIRRLRTQM